jgi:hypothetical protein
VLLHVWLRLAVFVLLSSSFIVGTTWLPIGTSVVTIQPTGAMGELAQQLRGGGSVEGKPLQFAGAFPC